MSRVVVHIDRLVLSGFRHADRDAVAAGVQQELQRAFANREVLARVRATGNIATVRVRGVEIAPRSSPRQVGETVARGIGREVTR
jgi:hypothetical protein